MRINFSPQYNRELVVTERKGVGNLGTRLVTIHTTAIIDSPLALLVLSVATVLLALPVLFTLPVWS